jgi:hypothetical protein
MKQNTASNWCSPNSESLYIVLISSTLLREIVCCYQNSSCYQRYMFRIGRTSNGRIFVKRKPISNDSSFFGITVCLIFGWALRLRPSSTFFGGSWCCLFLMFFFRVSFIAESMDIFEQLQIRAKVALRYCEPTFQNTATWKTSQSFYRSVVSLFSLEREINTWL